jgi:hypothetical protein
MIDMHTQMGTVFLCSDAISRKMPVDGKHQLAVNFIGIVSVSMHCHSLHDLPTITRYEQNRYISTIDAIVSRVALPTRRVSCLGSLLTSIDQCYNTNWITGLHLQLFRTNRSIWLYHANVGLFERQQQRTTERRISICYWRWHYCSAILGRYFLSNER